MGNSPSQQAASGPQIEPEDDFDLNAISDGSDDIMKGTKKKVLAPKLARKSRTKSLSSSASASKPSRTRPKKPGRQEKEDLVLEDYDYPAAVAEDTPMQDPDETTLNDTSTKVVYDAPPDRALQVPRTNNTGGSKRKKGSSIVVEIPPAKPRKRQRKHSSPTTSLEDTEKDLKQKRQMIKKASPEENGLRALEHDAALISRETTPQQLPKLPLKAGVKEPENGVNEVSKPEAAGDGTEIDEPPRRRSIATSVAKRSFPFTVKKAGESSRNLQDEEDEPEPELPSQPHGSVDAEEERHFGDSDDANSSYSPTSSPTFEPKPRAATQQRSSALKRRTKPLQRTKTSSQGDFTVEASGEVDQTKRPPRSQKKMCAECDEVFRSRKLLKEHGQETGHVTDIVRTEITGHFSDDEIRKLERYKTDFCRMYEITGHEFNDMMTDSCRRTPGQPWSYDIISKPDFLSQYFDVLPNRNRKSMARFRERNWQNATGSKDWTTEDDDQIVKLVAEIGTKWVEIGKALTRTQDAVQQRWVKHLQYRDTRTEGFWTPEENRIIAKAVAGVKKKGGLSQDASTDKRIAWSIISNALNGARTPKQCADHWQYLREKAEKFQAREERKARTSRPAVKKRRKQLSSEYIEDSENDLNMDELPVKGSGDLREPLEEDAMVSGAAPDMEVSLPEPTKSTPHSEDDGFVSTAQSRQATNDKRFQSRDGRSQSQNPRNEEQLGSPELTAPPKKTPGKIMTLSQAFANTQANTSGLRRTQKTLSTPVRDRPSPRMPVEPRPRSPVIEETPDEQDEAETQDFEETQEPSRFQSTTGEKAVPKASASDSEEESSSSSSSSSNEDEAVDDASVSEIPQSSASAPATTESDPEEPDLEDDLQPLPSMPTRAGSMETKKLPAKNDEDETSSKEETSSDESSDSDGDEETASDDDEDDESEDSMERNTRNDFMESVKQSAEKARLAKEQKKGKPVTEDSESDAESIQHG